MLKLFIKIQFIFVVLFICELSDNKLWGQNRDNDTLGILHEKVLEFKNNSQIDSALFYFDLIAEKYKADENQEQQISILIEKLNLALSSRKKCETQALSHALADYKNTENADVGLIIDAYIALGKIFRQNTDYENSLNYFLSCEQFVLQSNWADSSAVVNVYGEIASTYDDIGEFEKAKAYYLKKLNNAKRFFGEKHQQTIDGYMHTGYIFQRMAQYKLATEYYEKTLIVLACDTCPLTTKHGIINFNLGQISTATQEIDKAISFYEKSLDIFTQLLGNSNQRIVYIKGSLGAAYRQKGDFEKAIILTKESLSLIDSLYGKENLVYTYALNALGNIYFDKRNWKNAEETFNKALEIREKTLNKKHPLIAEMHLMYFSKLYIQKNEVKKALISCQEAILRSFRKYDKSIGLYETPEIQDYYLWQSLFEALKKKTEILKLLLQENNTFEKKQVLIKSIFECYTKLDTLIGQARKSCVTVSDKLELGEQSEPVYKNAVDFLINQSKTNKAKEQYYLRQAFEFSEKSKSAVFQSLLAHTEALHFGNVPDSLIRKEQEIRTEISHITKSIEEFSSDSIENRLRDKMFIANRKYEEHIAFIEKQFPDYYNIRHNEKSVEISKIQSKLGRKDAILSYCLSDSNINIFILHRKGLKVVTKPINDGFERLSNNFRKGIISKLDRFYAKFAFELFLQVFPAKEIPEHIKNLIIIPEGALTTIPFEALLYEAVFDKETTSAKDLSQYPYLIKKYNIAYAYSTKLWFDNHDGKSDIVENYEGDLLAVAPVFSDSIVAETSNITRSFLSSFVASSNQEETQRGYLLNGDYVVPLPASEREVKQLYEVFTNKGKKACVKTHEHANELFLKSDTIGRYKFLHIASHGFVNNEKPELSGLLMAQNRNRNDITITSNTFDNTMTSNDGILYSGEVYNLNLNADLVSLSACNTGLGQIRKGEGVIGLTQAFLYAGAKNITVSLWNVADQSTSELMVLFYDNIIENEELRPKQKQNYSSALRKAKLKMIQSEKYSHPYFWSPFVLIGN